MNAPSAPIPPPPLPPASSSVSQRSRQALMALCGLVTVGYLVYRGMYTLNHDGWYAGTASWLLYVAELWGGMCKKQHD